MRVFGGDQSHQPNPASNCPVRPSPLCGIVSPLTDGNFQGHGVPGKPYEEHAMRYLIAILLPPLAVLLCGKPVQFLLNILLTVLFWIPGMIHAILVVNSHLADKRTERLIKAVKSTV